MNRALYSKHPYHHRVSAKKVLLACVALLVLASMSCNMPSLAARPAVTSAPAAAAPTSLPTAAPTRASSPRPKLPPAIVEASPMPGSDAPLKGPFTLTFSQPMDRPSVEGAIQGQPALSGKFTWKDDATLTFIPDQPFLPATPISFTVNTSARAANGLGLPSPVTLEYHTAGPLRLTQSLPENGAKEVAPDSAIVAAFSSPVAALGESNAPAAFTLAPAAKGRGEWLNTSTYIYYPDPSLAGGSTYTVTLNPDLVSSDGAPFAKDTQMTWSFNTTFPHIDLVEPQPPDLLRLDGPVTIKFNIAMDAASTESNFLVVGQDGKNVTGKITWNDSYTQLDFKPDALLERNAGYTLTIKGAAQARGGVALGKDFTASLTTYPALAVTSTNPAQNGSLAPTGGGFDTVDLYFSAPVKSRLVNQWFSFSPELTAFNAYVNDIGLQLSITTYFQPSTTYTLTISPDLQDAWGQALGQPYQYTFKTPPAQPNLTLPAFQLGSQVTFLTPQDVGLSGQATNISQVQGTRGNLSMKDFFQLLAPDSYKLMQSYTPDKPVSWTQTLKLTPNRSETVTLVASPDGKPLATGLYYLILQSKQISSTNPARLILVVSPVQLTFKVSATQAAVWAVSLDKNQPMADTPITIFNEIGETLATGRTDANGLFQANTPLQKNTYQTFYAMSGSPGSQDFGMALSAWSQGFSSWEFAIPSDYSNPGPMAYLYTDRPIYRPGQVVNFRAVIRQADNGRYAPVDRKQVTVKIYGDAGMAGESPLLSTQTLDVSGYGTVNGTYTLAGDAFPGYYRIDLDLGNELQPSQLNFQVANYRKPEIDITVNLSQEELKSGQPAQGKVDLRYFFGAPAGNVPVNWTLSRVSQDFSLPGYQVGPLDTGWLSPSWSSRFLGSDSQGFISQGQDRTGPDGTLTISIPAEALQASPTGGLQQLTFEVTAIDESGQPVSKRATARLHPADFYIGAKPEAWASPSGVPLGFDLQTVDWKGNPSGNRALEAQFSKVTWVEQDSNNPFSPPTMVPEKSPAGSASPVTGSDGLARLAFTPQEPGTYILEVTGDGARTEVLVWVSGPGDTAWPDIPNQRLRLTADRAQYQPGQTAQVFIPNPFGPGALALVSVERGRVMHSQVISLNDSGYTLSLPLTEDDAPNVYLSVTLIGKTSEGYPDFRQGYVAMPVQPLAETLKVSLDAQPAQAAPGQNLTVGVRVTDSTGNPVKGEFSLALVDKAVLALADPNSADILSAFYASQPLGVRTALSLGGYARRLVIVPPGMGGGGGGGPAPSVVRENFPDTAYWNAAIETAADGTAQVTIPLPDSLTTWQADLRGLTADTRVGSATTQVVTSKDLLVRPQTPLFLVLGDHVEMAAVVNNNTAGELQVDVSLQANGLALDDPSKALQKVTIPANGRVRVAWWGTAQDVPAADLVFSAQSGSLQDSSRPNQGKLPILKYVSPQTFSTSGVLTEGGDRLELVNLPRSFTPTGGELRLELAPSLATAMFASLDSLAKSPADNSMSILSRFLPELEASRALKALGVDNPTLQARLDHDVTATIFKLLNQQNVDGGWSWWYVGQDPNVKSDPYITAYVLFGMAHANQAGASIQPDPIERAQKYLLSILATPSAKTEAWQLDQLAFELFALQASGEKNLAQVPALFDQRSRLSPASQAFLALTEEALSPGTESAKTLLSDLQSKALRSATGAHWETTGLDYRSPGTPIFNTAAVLYALAQRDPASPLLADAIRYLMAHRTSESIWASQYDSAWVLMALSEALKGTGDLQASFTFSATLNDSPFASGTAGGPNALTPITTAAPISSLFADSSNTLRINRDAGAGRLYYRADLQVNQPVEGAAALQRGLSLERAYFLGGQDCTKVKCEPISEIKLGENGQGQPITVRLTLTLPTDMYDLMVIDNVPAGAQIFNPHLIPASKAWRTSQPAYRRSTLTIPSATAGVGGGSANLPSSTAR